MLSIYASFYYLVFNLRRPIEFEVATYSCIEIGIFSYVVNYYRGIGRHDKDE